MPLLGQDTSVSGPDVLFLLETFQGRESLGIPYRYDLTLLSDDPAIPIDKVLGQPLTVSIQILPGVYRYFSGIVTYFAKLGLSMHHVRYAVVLNPKLSLFDYTLNCRIFNDPTNFDPDPEAKAPSQDAIQIVTQVLKDRDFTDVQDSTKKNHVNCDRRYCVQYRETDLNFVQRMLEDEGIYYFFKHDAQKHTMVLADSAAAHAKVTGYESILYLPKKRRQQREEEHFWSLTVAGSLYPGKYSVLQGYDYVKSRPKQPQIEDKLTVHKAPGPKFEEYDYPGGLQEKEQAAADAETRMQGNEVANTLIEVEGNTMGLGVGDLVKLHRPLDDMEHHPFWSDADFNKDYLITSATYSISINQYETGNAGADDEPFRAKYTLLDSHKQFRPARTAPKPRIDGPQTAVIVGPSNDTSDSKEEIYTDKLGRVKVKFDWDRSPGRNQKSSCWVRVAHVWAGQKWGSVHIPRVGQEVMVEFLDGDPDRPIITGRVYNADNMPPYDLPKNMTQSGIKSRSSKGGTDSNFNEIRFEDLKGKEELHIQAEKDMSTLVKHNQSTSVGADRSVSVGGNHSVSVTGKQSTTVTKDETQTYNANRKMTVKETNTDEITGAHKGTYKSTRTEVVDADDTLTVNDANKTITVHGKFDNTVDTEFKVTKAGTSMTITDDYLLNATGKWDLHNPGTGIIGEGSALKLHANAEFTISCGASSISLKSDGTIEIKGMKVKIGNANNNASFEPSGTTVNGVKITSAAVGMHEISGALIKIG
jgi:type VI secretion system secreted protein VgrG